MDVPAPPLPRGTHGMLALAVLGACCSGPLMAATGVAALAVAMWRNVVAAVLLAPFALRSRRDIRAIARADRRRIGWAGVMLACHFGTWTTALRMTSVASATALVCLQAAWVVLLVWWRRRRIGHRVLVGLVLGLTGTIVVSGFDLSVSDRALYGDLLALAGGLFGAVYVVIGGKVRETTSTTSYTFTCYGVCGLLLLAVCLLARVRLFDYAAVDWLRIIAVTLAAQIVGHSLINHVLAVLTPSVVSLALLLETPGAALLAGVFLGQQPPLAVYLGIVLVLAGLFLVITDPGSSLTARAPD
jgi:drug/metabolite transporter (DMT)-like permease